MPIFCSHHHVPTQSLRFAYLPPDLVVYVLLRFAQKKTSLKNKIPLMSLLSIPMYMFLQQIHILCLPLA